MRAKTSGATERRARRGITARAGAWLAGCVAAAVAVAAAAAGGAIGVAAAPSRHDAASRGEAAPPAQQTPAPGEVRPRIVGLAHVAFRVTDAPSARAFYGGVLGLAPAVAPGGRAGCLRYAVNERQQILLEPGLPSDEDERLSYLAFETTDIEGLAAYLRDHGVTPETGVLSSACTAPALWVKDPDGHAIAFIGRRLASAEPSAAAAARPRTAISARILHAGLTVRDAAAADRFYKTVLGFSEIWRGGRTDDVTSWINMKVPEGTDYLEYMLVSGPITRQQRGTLHHVALLVPDIQEAYELALRRTPPETRDLLASPQVGRNRRWQLNLYDADGTRVELMEPFTMR